MKRWFGCQHLVSFLCNSPDTTPPVVTLLGANPQITEGGQRWIDPGATATDLISGPIRTITLTPRTGVNIHQPGNQNVLPLGLGCANPDADRLLRPGCSR